MGECAPREPLWGKCAEIKDQTQEIVIRNSEIVNTTEIEKKK
jgi:hypothetical protein